MTAPIIVGYDGSDHAADALALGRLLARRADVPLVAVCAYPDDPLGDSATALELARGIRADAEAALAKARAALGPDADDADFRAIAGPTPARVLHELAEQLGAAAVVVGATHHGAAVRLLTGSTPERVLDGSPCPVAVAPQGYAQEPAAAVGRIAVAFDGSAEATSALEAAARLARRTGARLRLVTAVNAALGVYPPLDPTSYTEISQLARDDARERTDRAIAALDDVDAEGVVVDGDPVTVLIEESADDDLVFAGSRGRGPFRRVLLGSVSGHLLRGAHCPVVVVPRGPEQSEGDAGDAAGEASAS